MNAVQIKFYDLLRKDLNLSDDKAAAFIETLGQVVEFELKNEKDTTATKGDVLFLKEDIHRLEIKLE